ncbi:hypothetical protein ZIOFF_029878 [Zingiber officinale]|uniref:Cullin-associated NEDD8-dissociated protein 1 n=1 Tax=Zingiber officinale TaxID=94328 RepID=A0A8J5GXD2_ZINOF|nr:hypothetical protein ZIOFF_029878 [Zingiber officinale]
MEAGLALLEVARRFTHWHVLKHSSSSKPFDLTVRALSSPVLSAVGERYYKVTAEALRVCGELVRVLRPNFETSMPDFRPYVSPIYSAILARLANQDQDQEVKECAISCMSLVISTFGDNLQKDLPACLPILVDRMGNEITRLTAVKAFAVIANSPLRINLSCVLEQVVSELTGFLRKANRALRQATLGTLNSLVVAYGEQISSTTYEVIIVELSTLISEADLHMTALALELCCTMMMAKISSQSVGVTVSHKVLPQALILIRSSLLQGQALQALQRFFASLVHSANTSFDSLLDSLLSSAKPSPQSGGLAKQALHSVAQCVAVLCLAAGDQKCASTVDMLKGILKDDSNMNSAKQHLALLCLGEIGRRKDLSVHVHIENIVIESFQSPFEEIKSAASYALGNIAVGNLSKYLPFILDQIDNQQKKQYLLLHSLKEVIARQSIDQPGNLLFIWFFPRWLLNQEVPKIVKSINRQLREKSIKTKVGAFSVLKELVLVLPNCLAEHISALVSGIEKALTDKSSTSNLKIEALVFTRLVMASHSPSVFHPYIKASLALMSYMTIFFHRHPPPVDACGRKKEIWMESIHLQLLPCHDEIPCPQVDTSTKLSLDTFASHLRVQLGAAAMDHVLKKSLDFLITISLKLSLKCLLDARLLRWRRIDLSRARWEARLALLEVARRFTHWHVLKHSSSSKPFDLTVRALSSPVLSAVGERYYKVTAEALRVCGELVRVLRPNFETSMPDFRPYVSPIYSAILARLANQDQDQEVKECAISCMSLVISTFGDNLQKDLPACLPILVDRMGNEITRLTAVKAFAVIANSPLRINLSCVLEQVVSELTGFLRKANRALRQATLGTLNSLVVAYGEQISSTTYEVIIVELSTLISEADLHMTALALELCCTMMMAKISSQSVGVTVSHKVLPQALILIRSSLLQGQALQALQRFFASLVHSANTSFDSLLDSLLSSAKPSPQSGGLAKQALHSVAQCVAVLCLAAGDQKCASTVDMLKGILKDDSNMNSAKQHLALLCLGEIGRRKDLSVHVHIENIVIESFQSPFEEIKSAASYALGNIAVGNLSKYLPFILDQIDNQQKKQYLLLHSLKEVIARQSIDQPGKSELQESNVEKILSLLFNHCESDEEGVRNVVAECLGKIALIEPKKLVPALKERTASSTAFTRATVVIAIKYAIVERPEKIDEILYPEISTFLMLIKDSDRHVRRAAVLALSTAAHNKPNLIKGLLPELLPLLYDQTVIKKEMIRTVDLGPFKHIVDDGLELRKAAFECVDTLLDSCLDQMNPSTFIVPYLISGLSDHYDVKMPCHLILSKLADKCPAAVLAVLDSLVDPLEKTISHKPKADAVKQEVDRNEDMIRSAFRAIASISRISGGEYSLKFKMLINNILNTAALAEKYNFVR